MIRVAGAMLWPLLLTLGSLAFFGFLLWRHAYDGLYGIDAYAYYYQAKSLWFEMLGQSQPGFVLFGADGLQHWPVGYHLQIIAGFLLTGESPVGGRLLTLCMAALCPALVYVIAVRLELPAGTARVAGVVAAALLPLNATYTRMALSLMADVPALFFVLLSFYCALRVPRGHDEETNRASSLAIAFWPWAAGLFFGLALLLRYSSVVSIVPVALLLLNSARRQGKVLANAGLFVLGAVLALVPQLMYTLSHQGGESAGGYLSSFSLSNILATEISGPDGTSRFATPNLIFYLLGPVTNVEAGFYSPLLVAPLLVGIAALILRRRVLTTAVHACWWVVPAIGFSTTPYQAHRFTILYAPAVALLVGTGVAVGSRLLLQAVSGKLKSSRRGATIAAGGALLVLALFVIGAFSGYRSVRDWVATHSAWQSSDLRAVNLARRAVELSGQAGEPRAVTFGFSGALYHHTGWPVAELYNYDEDALRAFLGGQGPRVAAIPLGSLEGQWAGTLSAQRWRWLQSEYSLSSVGHEGGLTIFTVLPRR